MGFKTEFKIHKARHFSIYKPTADCPKCDKKDQRMIKGVCSYCYQAEYSKKRKEEREKYTF